MKKRKKAIFGAVMALVFLAALYRLWPHSFRSILGAESGNVTEVSCFLTMYKADYELRQNSQTFYLLKTGDPGLITELLDILGDSGYQDDFGNLRPGGADGLGGGKNYDGRMVDIELSLEGRERPFRMSLLARDNGMADSKIVHPTNRKMFDRLAEYLQKEGVPWPAGMKHFTRTLWEGLREGWMLEKKCILEG